MKITLKEFKERVELSLVNQYLCENDVFNICKEAKNLEIGAVCVNPTYIKTAKVFLEKTLVNISANVGFPFGTNLTEVKALETKKAIEDGANQIDMVIDVGALRSKKDDLVYSDINQVVKIAKKNNVLVKVIIETWVLNKEEKIRACKIVENAGADILKTTTGVKTQYLYEINSKPVGATIEDIVLLRNTLGANMKIKASGGIYNIKNAIEMLKAGANQLGVSKGIDLINEFITNYGNCCEI